MKQNESNEYAMIDLERYEHLIADKQNLNTLLFLIYQSTKYSNSKKDLIIVNDEDILKYIRKIDTSYETILMNKKSGDR
ncbi:MAG TPA: hypothetical protein DCQ45_06680 [Erysipelotrichaceae bacterium]|nr:hypothetical protein [Erysipelotrichaceae bacterium]